MGVIKQINIKIELIIFTMTLLISEILMQNHTKTSILTKMDILQLNKYS